MGRNITTMVRALGVPSTEVDGNDVVACYEAINESLVAARSGEGPQFVELHTFRHLEHCGPNEDDHLGYREPGELASWLAKDPILLFQNLLAQTGFDTKSFVDSYRAEIAIEINDAFVNAKNAPFPDLESCLSDVYA
jgi:pyruvate dehydrogenase E1 component alpha subunit